MQKLPDVSQSHRPQQLYLFQTIGVQIPGSEAELQSVALTVVLCKACTFQIQVHVMMVNCALQPLRHVNFCF